MIILKDSTHQDIFIWNDADHVRYQPDNDRDAGYDNSRGPVWIAAFQSGYPQGSYLDKKIVDRNGYFINPSNGFIWRIKEQGQQRWLGQPATYEQPTLYVVHGLNPPELLGIYDSLDLAEVIAEANTYDHAGSEHVQITPSKLNRTMHQLLTISPKPFTQQENT